MSTKIFANAADNNALFAQLKAGSNSEQAAKTRLETYARVINNYREFSKNLSSVRTRRFAGVTEIYNEGNQLFNATLAAYTRSFAGFLSIERDMDQGEALLKYLDLIGVTDGRRVLPNIGSEDLQDTGSKQKHSVKIEDPQEEIQFSPAVKIIPGSVHIIIKVAATDKEYHIHDNKKGKLWADAGVLSSGEVNYSQGTITFTPALTDLAADDVVDFVYVADLVGMNTADKNNRFTLKEGYYRMRTVLDSLIGEGNIATFAGTARSMGMDPAELLGAKLTELYVKYINARQVHAIVDNYVGDTVEMDEGSWKSQWHIYESQLSAFKAGLEDVDLALGKKAVKGCAATAYVVGINVASYFKKLSIINGFTKATDQNYINDLIGTTDSGIPVLLHTDIDPNEGYAVCKTSDGTLAPVLRGIFLPLSDTPGVGNFADPTQYAQGVYFQEGNELIVPELVQKFKLISA